MQQMEPQAVELVTAMQNFTVLFKAIPVLIVSVLIGAMLYVLFREWQSARRRQELWRMFDRKN